MVEWGEFGYLLLFLFLLYFSLFLFQKRIFIPPLFLFLKRSQLAYEKQMQKMQKQTEKTVSHITFQKQIHNMLKLIKQLRQS